MADAYDDPEECIVIAKLDTNRCVFNNVDDIKISRRTRKRARHFELTVDKCFDDVVDACIKQHGPLWLACVCKEFRAMHANPSETTKMHSVELWDGDELIAGEIGWACGSVYTR